MNLRPIKKNVLLRMDARKTQSTGGILLPERAQETQVFGQAVAVGKDCQEIKAGDRVMILKTAGTHFIHQGQDYVLLGEHKATAVVV